MTDLTSLGLETTAEERKAVPTWRAINGDSPFMARFLRDFDKLAAEVTRLRALTTPGEEGERAGIERAISELDRDIRYLRAARASCLRDSLEDFDAFLGRLNRIRTNILAQGVAEPTAWQPRPSPPALKGTEE